MEAIFWIFFLLKSHYSIRDF